MNGWIILDKPLGMSSAHAVAKAQRLLSLPSPLAGEGWVGGNKAAPLCDTPHLNPPPQGGRKNKIKIGHAGTLDPLASGVLPLALGEATKTIPLMVDAQKAYAFTVTWGEQRDTDDKEGAVTATSPNRPTREQIEALLPRFTGVIQQVPPNYSAIKVEGKRAYSMARSGENVELKAREVTVYTMELTDITTNSTGLVEQATFRCECSKGTYIRSLGRDMGAILGCFGHISYLRRLKVGHFNENHAISLDILEELVHKGDPSFVLPVEAVLDDIPAVEITSPLAVSLKQGQVITLTPPLPEGHVVVKCNGQLVAIGDLAGNRLKPVRVFNL